MYQRGTLSRATATTAPILRMSIDPTNPVVALCVAGMQVDGEPEKARALFEQAWNARRDDFDASVAAHFLARHQPTAEDTLHWNEVALKHADALDDDRVLELYPSLCLNLADSYYAMRRPSKSRELAHRAAASLSALPAGGYGEFVRGGVIRLLEKLARESAAP